MPVEIELDEKALEAARLAEFTGFMPPSERLPTAIRAYLAAALPAPSSNMVRVTELLEELDRGVVAQGMHEDNSTELFDVDGATDTMFEAAQTIRALLPNVETRASVIEEPSMEVLDAIVTAANRALLSADPDATNVIHRVDAKAIYAAILATQPNKEA